MAIILEATYSKKLGLPHYSSHCYVVSLRTELTDLTQVDAQSAELYALLQQSVDKELKEVGYLPEGAIPAIAPSSNGHHSVNGTGKPTTAKAQNRQNGNTDQEWSCSEKQRALVLRIVDENKLPKQDVEDLSQQLFGVGVTECDKMQASQLIEELLEKVGKKSTRHNRWRQSARK